MEKDDKTKEDEKDQADDEFKMTPLGQIPAAKEMLEKYKSGNKNKKGSTDGGSNIVHTDKDAQDKGNKESNKDDEQVSGDQPSKEQQEDSVSKRHIGSMDFHEYMKHRQSAKTIAASQSCTYKESDGWDIVERDGLHLIIQKQEEKIKVHYSEVTI